MNAIQMWGFGLDVGLFLSLVVLSWRFLKSGAPNISTARLVQLETSLRMLIQEAEGAGKGFDDQLRRRQKRLEDLLFDLNSTEQRINQTITSADRSKSALERAINQSNEIGAEPVRSVPVSKPVQPAVSSTIELEQDHRAEEYIGVSSLRQHPPQEQPERSTANRTKYNIYGDPITATPSAPNDRIESRPSQPMKPGYVPLESAIERVVGPGTGTGPEQYGAVNGELEDVYAAAEELIKGGQALQAVAAAVNLPIEEVRMLSQMVRQEEAVARTSEAVIEDDRLGVLSPVRRERHVL